MPRIMTTVLAARIVVAVSSPRPVLSVWLLIVMMAPPHDGSARIIRPSATFDLLSGTVSSVGEMTHCSLVRLVPLPVQTYIMICLYQPSCLQV